MAGLFTKDTGRRLEVASYQLQSLLEQSYWVRTKNPKRLIEG